MGVDSDEYDLLDSEIENGLSELNQAIAIPLKNKRKLVWRSTATS